MMCPRRIDSGVRPQSRRAIRCWFLTLGAVSGLMSGMSIAVASDTVIVTDLDGRKATGLLASWTDEKVSLTGKTTQEWARRDIRSLTFETTARKTQSGQPMIWLSNGDRIAARPVSVVSGVLTVEWIAYSPSKLLKIPLEKTVAAIFDLPMSAAERLRLYADLETFPAGSDLVMLTNGDQSTGEVRQVDAAFVEFKTTANTLKLDRSRVRAIRFDPELTNTQRITGRRVLISLTDGSRITATRVELGDHGMVRVTTSGTGEIELPLKSISSSQLFGEHVIPITDYEPAKVEFTPYLSSTWTLGRNVNVLRGPLVVRGTEYATGLGMHSRMSVTYELRGNEQTFQSVVGLDDISAGLGNVVFGVELDHKPVWSSSNLTGKSAAISLPDISLRGTKTLTLLVDFGQFGDVSDYADWCDAVLILDPAR